MEKNTLTVYRLGGPLLSTEWSSLMGDKYRGHMDFETVLVQTPEEARVIVWDGVLTPKSAPLINDVMAKANPNTVFLITGEAQTLFQDHPFVKLGARPEATVFLPPSRTLPEDLLEALEECRKRMAHV